MIENPTHADRVAVLKEPEMFGICELKVAAFEHRRGESPIAERVVCQRETQRALIAHERPTRQRLGNVARGLAKPVLDGGSRDLLVAGLECEKAEESDIAFARECGQLIDEGARVGGPCNAQAGV